VGDVAAEPDDHVIDCTDRLIMPGFVDAHSHADGLLTGGRDDDGVQRALLRQGVTTIIAGQDGVSYAPGDGAYATEYFGAINGPFAGYSGGGIAGYLAAIDESSRLNAAVLVPAGTVRWEVCGRSQEPADAAELAAMADLVARGMADGAVGLSTGLDYVPGMFQDADEIAALCAPVARAAGVYVSHMRGGYERNAAAGIDEIATIAERVHAASGASLAVHVSHFHADADIVIEQMDALAVRGLRATFDAYPYIRGCSLMSMPLLPPELTAQPVDDVLIALADPDERKRLRREWFPKIDGNPSLGPDWPRMLTLAHVPADEYDWTHGLTIASAAEKANADPISFALDVLAATRLQANVVMAVAHERPASELARIFAHPTHVAGSDGIFIGAHPHPRARGTFGCYLREYVRELGTWSWADAARHLSRTAVERFGLGRRGVVETGAVADLIVIDPRTVADRATYEQPLRESVGIDDVLVAGIPVLAGGELTAALPGRGLRREGLRREDVV
jgi:N-acyl-D-amino-acid deacylase